MHPNLGSGFSAVIAKGHSAWLIKSTEIPDLFKPLCSGLLLLQRLLRGFKLLLQAAQALCLLCLLLCILGDLNFRCNPAGIALHSSHNSEPFTL